MQPKPWSALVLALGSPLALTQALGCSDDVTVADAGASTAETSASTDGTTSADATSEVTTDPDTTDVSESESESETGEPPPPTCGDGVLNLGEECDDGNDDDTDGCNSACQSACGTQGYLDLTLDEGWFDIQVMAAGPDATLVALGDVEVEGKAGRLRAVEVAEDQVLGAVQSDPLGSIGTPELPQTHQIVALARTAAGDSILALGTSTEVLAPGEDPVVSHWLARFDGGDLSEQWRVVLPVDGGDPDLRPIGLGALANGDPIVTRTLAVAPNDTDIGFERRSAQDGDVVWTSSYSGELDGGWSFDTAGLVAVSPDDRVWTTGIVRVDWQTFETNLFELDPDTGAVLWSDVPLPDPGNVHEQRIGSLAAGPGGAVAVGINVLGPATPFHFGAAYAYVERELAWELLPEDLPWDGGDPYLSPQVSVDADGEVLVVGSYTHDFEIATASRPWVVAMSPEGLMLCAARIGQGTDAAVVPAIGFFGSSRGAVNLDTYGPGGMGPGSAGNWIAALRGW